MLFHAVCGLRVFARMEDEEAGMIQRRGELTTLFNAFLDFFSTFALGGLKQVLTKTAWYRHLSATGHGPHVSSLR